MIVLDTHALVWWVSADSRLSAAARQVIEQEMAQQGKILVSAISAWEIAMLIEKGRLTLTMDVDEWLDKVASIEVVSFVSITPRVAVQSTRLPGSFHADPADRLIVALARESNALLITADGRIQAYPHLKWLW
ncbi:type II toxin-antitoxin system VapC family toxin [Halomonas sp. GXIMD04776]|uniref:type II toxin-antitoxin system VapC family toxin n=1 Tax=Halomonas sp. GXIMD04776 TaxID=3415605 RepID=UPI003CBF5B5A